MLRPALLIMPALGLLLLLKGLRGRRVGSSLHCRCGDCLEGLKQPKTCPECAAAVWDPINTRRGVLRRTPIFAWIGTVLLIFGSSAWLTLRVAAPPGTNPCSWQPDPLLTLQSPDNGLNGHWFAAEIIDRVEAGAPSPSHRADLAARARARINAQQWRHDAPGYRTAFAWAAIYAALWRAGTVPDEQLLDMLTRSLACGTSADQYSSGGSASQTATMHHVVQFAIRSPLRTLTQRSPAHNGVALNGEFAQRASGSIFGNATGDLADGPCHNLTLDLASLTRVDDNQIQISVPLARSSSAGAPPPPAPTHLFWIITVHVPPIDLATGLPNGMVTPDHRFAGDDPVAAAKSRWYQRRDQEVFERMRLEYEARQQQPP